MINDSDPVVGPAAPKNTYTVERLKSRILKLKALTTTP